MNSNRNLHLHWGFIIESVILGFFIGIGIESCGKHIGEGISKIKITIVQGGESK